jgi:glucan phosphoethanolaminetransferase (alkaline phosphatase superfamily)
LSDIIHTQEKTFTYLIKYGAHFHYESSYPDSIRIFTPIQEKTNYERKDKTKLLNSYFNAMYWGVDVFFKKMFDKLKDRNVLIIYTSDHGQNILDDLNTDLTHCAKGEVNQVMASVPLFITATNQIYIDNLRLKIPDINKNKGSHFELFPTLLHMMHYDSCSIKTRYGHSLFDTLAIKERNFYSGDLFGRGNFFKNKMTPYQK